MPVKNSKYGNGTISYEKVGKYEYFSLQYFDGTGKRHKKRFPHTKEGEKEAKKFQKEISRKKDDGILVNTNYTLATWCSFYIKEFKKDLKDSSLERMTQTFSLVEVSPIASIPLDKVTGDKIQSFYNLLGNTWTDETGKDHKKLSSSSILKVHRLISAACKKAVQLRIISYNPADSVDAPKLQTKQMSVFTDKEIANIFKAIDAYKEYKYNKSVKHDYHLLFQMLLECGVRIGELLALQWQDIDLVKEQIHIHSTKSRDTQDIHSPKTKNANRIVPILTDDLLARLKAFRNDGNTTKISGFLFANKNGGAISYQRVFLVWQRLCEIAGIEKSIHTFRHTFCTRLLEKGVPVAEVSRLAGHSNPAITYSVYTHSLPNYDEKLKKMFRKKKSRKRNTDTKSDTKKLKDASTMPFKSII